MLDLVKRNILLLVVFLTGAAVLVIEVVAVRILSPYYGNTIFTVSSIISIVLAALSFGYYFGGKLADKYPYHKWFYSIIFLSGVSVLVLQMLILFVLPFLGYSLSLIWGPLISAVLLFFIPGLLLGMLSPFVIKLQHLITPEKGIGSVAGGIFFWSTFGSIAGSLAAGFVLIPNFGINAIISSTGILLLLMGAVGLASSVSSKKKVLISVILPISLLILAGSSSGSFFMEENVLYQKDGVYEKLTVYDGEYDKRPTRFFMQDRSGSGAMFLDSDELVYDYTKYYSLYKIFTPKLKNALIVGGGAYSVPKAILKDNPSEDISVDVSEIEPSLFELSKKFFNVQPDVRLHNFVEDGRRFLSRTDKKYDLIFSDVYYSLFSIPSHFTTREFFEIAKNGLSDDGVFIANIIGDLSRKGDSFIFPEMRTFKEVFDNSYFFAVNDPASLSAQNIIFVGYKNNKKIDFDKVISLYKDDEILSGLKDKIIDPNRFELSSYPVLTDNFAPTDYLIASVLKDSLAEENTFLNGDEMLALIFQQLRYGPRYLGSLGHEKEKNFLLSEMKLFSNDISIQSWQHASQDGSKDELTNIIAKLDPSKERRIVLATHYDSKRYASNDNKDPKDYVPGANDSASGPAVLVELARYLNAVEKKPNVGIDIIFFDGEEGERDLASTEWVPLGSKYFSENIDKVYKNNKPEVGIVLDMVCDKDLSFKKEKGSAVGAAKEWTDLFWASSKEVYPKVFSDSLGLEILDDHNYLTSVGIPTFLLIDFDYPWFHTTKDTLDKCSPKSLEITAKSILKYIYSLK